MRGLIEFSILLLRNYRFFSNFLIVFTKIGDCLHFTEFSEVLLGFSCIFSHFLQFVICQIAKKNRGESN